MKRRQEIADFYARVTFNDFRHSVDLDYEGEIKPINPRSNGNNVTTVLGPFISYSRESELPDYDILIRFNANDAFCQRVGSFNLPNLDVKNVPLVAVSDLHDTLQFKVDDYSSVRDYVVSSFDELNELTPIRDLVSRRKLVDLVSESIEENVKNRFKRSGFYEIHVKSQRLAREHLSKLRAKYGTQLPAQLPLAL
tara:strand:- start:9129 stop:9713 length:585 start_codon:yes stop_codon:yes gene_type:complete